MLASSLRLPAAGAVGIIFIHFKYREIRVLLWTTEGRENKGWFPSTARIAPCVVWSQIRDEAMMNNAR